MKAASRKRDGSGYPAEAFDELRVTAAALPCGGVKADSPALSDAWSRSPAAKGLAQGQSAIIKRQTPNHKPQTTNHKLQTPNSKPFPFIH